MNNLKLLLFRELLELNVSNFGNCIIRARCRLGYYQLSTVRILLTGRRLLIINLLNASVVLMVFFVVLSIMLVDVGI